MGHGIAQAFAVNGYDVVILSRNKTSLQKALRDITWSLNKFAEKGTITKTEVESALSRIHTTTSMQDATKNIDLAVEAITENMELKKQVFSQIDQTAPPHTIIATNTSTLRVTEMRTATQRPQKTVGMHWLSHRN
jgi:3-hydroxyacyl-CoA dehydrogenase